MFKKIAGIVVLTAVAGVLIFGAINRTFAKNENGTKFNPQFKCRSSRSW